MMKKQYRTPNVSVGKDTVGSEIVKPSFCNSPWIRGAPQVGFSPCERPARALPCRPACGHPRVWSRKAISSTAESQHGATRLPFVGSPASEAECQSGQVGGSGS